LYVRKAAAQAFSHAAPPGSRVFAHAAEHASNVNAEGMRSLIILTIRKMTACLKVPGETFMP
jgi:hypothetical protein